MNIRLLLCTIISVLSLGSCSFLQDEEPMLVDYVYTRLGTLSYGYLCFGGVYPAVSLPWGMNAWTPQTEPWGSSLIYNYSTDRIVGFRQSHIASLGEKEFGAFSIMPVPSSVPSDEEGRASLYSHKYERSTASRYNVFLATHNIDMALTALDYSAMFNIVFNEPEVSNDIILDLFPGGSYIEIVNDTTVLASTAQNSSPMITSDFKNYIILCLDRPMESYEIIDMTSGAVTDSVSGEHLALRMKFRPEDNHIHIKTASSFIGFPTARANLEEIEGMDFEQIVLASRKRWETILGRFDLNNASVEDKRLFYSVLYRALLSPKKTYEPLDHTSDDAGTIYYGLVDGKLYDGYMYNFANMYLRTFSQMPMISLFYPDRVDRIYSALDSYVRQAGDSCRLSDLAILRVASDIRSEGHIDKYPTLKARLEADSSVDIRSIKYSLDYPYIVKDTLFVSQQWIDIWDMYINGTYKTEAGADSLERHLDELFSSTQVRSDVSEWIYSLLTVSRMGKYFHSYPPMQAAPYLYHYTASPQKCQYWCREIIDRSYKLTPDGFSGPDISGTLSSWFILSSLGFYPIDLTSNIFIAASPLYKQVFVTYDSGEQLWISASKDKKKKYILNLTIDGKLVDNEIPLEKLRAGGSLDFNMTDKDIETYSLYSSLGELLTP